MFRPNADAIVFDGKNMLAIDFYKLDEIPEGTL
jgi:hypothetical protein